MDSQIFRKKLGQALRRWRTKKRLTQTALARRAGVHLNTIHKSESALADLQVLTLVQICAALDISPAKILARLRIRPDDIHPGKEN